MTKIKPTYVTFEQAKLINYPFLTDFGYSLSGNIIERKGFIATNGWINMPEQWQVVEWLRVKYGIWVSVHLEYCRGCEGYDFNFQYINDKEKTIKEQKIQYETLGETVFDLPQEAYSAAFDYTLNKLI